MKPKAFEAIAGKARVAIGEELGLTDKDRFAFAFRIFVAGRGREQADQRAIIPVRRRAQRAVPTDIGHSVI